jgi:hypothetical protein
MSTRKRWFYQTNWFWWLFFGALAAPFLVSACNSWWAIHRHGPVRDTMDLAILRLSLECPNELSEHQWGYCIVWTWIMHGNFGCTHLSVPTEDLNRIADDLNRRIDEGADLDTIDWIWDEYLLAYPRIAVYEHWRPTGPENKETFENLKTGVSSNYSLSELRENYQRKLAELVAE